jgi:hypothetical protein
MKDFMKALEAVQAVLRYVERTNDATAASLKEGMDETFTIHRLELPGILRRSLVSTNIIESAISRYREITRNVKRWHSGDQKRRWAATALMEAERSFRRIKGTLNVGQARIPAICFTPQECRIFQLPTPSKFRNPRLKTKKLLQKT